MRIVDSGQRKIEKVKELTAFAEKGEPVMILVRSSPHLRAYVFQSLVVQSPIWLWHGLHHTLMYDVRLLLYLLLPDRVHVLQASTVILGATKPEQVIDNLKALDVIKKITPEVCNCSF
jgi:hypothetical protein